LSEAEGESGNVQKGFRTLIRGIRRGKGGRGGEG